MPPGATDPVGLAVNSFSSVSLEPPLVSFCAARSSLSWAGIDNAGRFCVNILADDQEEICRAFAARGPEKFRGIGWTEAPSGSPVLAGVLAWVDCTIHTKYDAGDHVIVLGRVNELQVVREGRPLVFFRGGYGRFES